MPATPAASAACGIAAKKGGTARSRAFSSSSSRRRSDSLSCCFAWSQESLFLFRHEPRWRRGAGRVLTRVGRPVQAFAWATLLVPIWRGRRPRIGWIRLHARPGALVGELRRLGVHAGSELRLAVATGVGADACPCGDARRAPCAVPREDVRARHAGGDGAHLQEGEDFLRLGSAGPRQPFRVEHQRLRDELRRLRCRDVHEPHRELLDVPERPRVRLQRRLQALQRSIVRGAGREGVAQERADLLRRRRPSIDGRGLIGLDEALERKVILFHERHLQLHGPAHDALEPGGEASLGPNFGDAGVDCPPPGRGSVAAYCASRDMKSSGFTLLSCGVTSI